MKLLLFASLLLSLTRAQAQAQAPCGCRQNFDQMRRLTEANYAGYRDKVTAATRPRFDSLTTALQAQADTAGQASCWQVLQRWTRFFRDGHLGVQGAQPGRLNPDSVRARYAGWERLPWTRATFRAYLDDPGRPKKRLEGIWRDGGGDYEVGIVAVRAAGYQGFILRADSIFWVPGQVKFVFADPANGPVSARYYMRNHNVEDKAVEEGSNGQLFINGPWYRAYPRPAGAANDKPEASHSFRMLDDTTALYRIASFDGNYRPLIDSLTRTNAANLRRTRLLILDLRGNGGGSDGSYRSLTPYLYANPMQEVGTLLWSTPLNNAKYGDALFPNMSAAEKRKYAQLRQRLDARLGQFVNPQGNQIIRPIRLKPSEQHPEVRRVAVLQDGECGSTTEQFLLMARQSRKTTLFGKNSYGSLDYANVQDAPLPCYNMQLYWATSRSHRLDRGEGIDNVGVAPTVRLDPYAPDMVEQVRAWYRRPRPAAGK